jgi:hypothetical protein
MTDDTATPDQDLPTTLLERLPKYELKQERYGGRRNEFQFERNVLSAAGMTHEQEVALMRGLVGEDRWNEAQTPPEEEPETEEE